MSSYPHQPTRSVYVVVLKKTDPSPLAPESDEEKIAAEDKKPEPPSDKPAESDQKADSATAAAQPSPSPKPDDKKAPPRVTIDFERADQRILALPIPARNFVGLAAAKANKIGRAHV